MIQEPPQLSARRLSRQAEQLGEENARLRQECERLGRVIDSGDWGRQRVQELAQAGRMLQEERDGLAALVGALQAQQAQQTQQTQLHAERRPLQEQHGPLTLGGGGAAQCDIANSLSAATCATSGPQAGPPQHAWLLGTANGAAPQVELVSSAHLARPASPGKAAAARNRLLVQSGSSFNALVRTPCALAHELHKLCFVRL